MKEENKKVALKSGYYFMIFDKDDVSFIKELVKTNTVVCVDNEEYYLYEAPTWELAQKIDNLMGDNDLGMAINEMIINKNVDKGF